MHFWFMVEESSKAHRLGEIKTCSPQRHSKKCVVDGSLLASSISVVLIEE
jgi:hypothetical protein